MKTIETLCDFAARFAVDLSDAAKEALCTQPVAHQQTTGFSRCFTGAAAFGLVLLFTITTQAASLNILSGQVKSLGAPGVSTNYSFDSITIEEGGKLTIAGDVTLNVTSNVLVNGDIEGGLEVAGEDGDAGGDGADGAIVGGVAQYGGDGGDGGDGGAGKTPLGGVYLTIIAAFMTVNGSINFDMSLDGGNGGDSGDGGKGGDGASPLPSHYNGGDGGLGGFGGFAGDGGFGGGSAFLTITLLSINQGGHYVGSSFVLGTNGVISLNNSSKGGDGGKGGDAGDGGAGGNGINAGAGGKGGNGGLAGWGGDGGAGGSASSLEIDASMIDLEGTISMHGGDGGDGGDAGKPGQGGNGGDSSSDQNGYGPNGGDGGNGGDWYACSDNGIPCSEAGNGGNGGNGGLFFLETTFFTNHAMIDLSGGDAGNGGKGQAANVGVGGNGGAAGGGSQPGMKGDPSLAIPDGNPGLPGADGYFSITSLGGGKFANSTVGGWQISGNGTFDFSYDQDNLTDALSLLSASASGPFAVFATVRNPQIYYDYTAGKWIYETNAPVEFNIAYKWLNTLGSLDVLLGGKVVLHLEAPAVLGSGFTTANFILPPQLPANPALRFQLNGGAQVLLESYSLQAQPMIPWLTVTRSSGNPSALDFFWFGATNESYQVQSRTSLNTGSWQGMGSSVLGQGTNEFKEITISAGEPTHFYRLQMAPVN